MATVKLTKSLIEKLGQGPKRVVVYDSEVTGLHVVVTPKGKKTFNLWYRSKSRRTATMKLGDWPLMTLFQARSRAKELLYEVAKGEDPARARAMTRAAPTVSEFCDRYIAEHVDVHNKPTTAREFRRLVETRVRPALGNIKMAEVTRSDVAKFHLSMRISPYVANRALAVLSKMFGLAEDWGVRPDGTNPCRRVKRFPEKERGRFLTEEELARLGGVLVEAGEDGSVQPTVLNTVWLLALTGCRVSEVLNLKWDDVDFDAGTLHLKDAKAGDRLHAVGAPTMAFLNQIERGNGDSLVVGKRLSVWLMDKNWVRIRHRAGLQDCRLHDLRHTVGTYAGQTGANAFLIRDKLGHKTLAMTGRYVQADEAPLRVLSDRIEGRISAAMRGHKGEVVSLRRDDG